jgi:ribosomal protein L37E
MVNRKSAITGEDLGEYGTILWWSDNMDSENGDYADETKECSMCGVSNPDMYPICVPLSRGYSMLCLECAQKASNFISPKVIHNFCKKCGTSSFMFDSEGEHCQRGHLIITAEEWMEQHDIEKV